MKFSAIVTLAICLFSQTAAICANSIAEAYLEQGKKAYDRGDLMAAKRLFNTAATNSVRSADAPLHMAAIFNNAGEAYRRIFEERGRSYQSDDDDRATAHWLKRMYRPDNDNDYSIESPAWLACTYLKAAVEIKERQLGSFSLDLSRSLENLAVIYQETGRQDEAEALTRKALQIHETKEGMNSPAIGSLCFRLGKSLKARADGHLDPEAKIAALQDAISNFNRADKAWSAQGGPELTCAADKELGLAYFALFSLNNNMQQLLNSESHYDEADGRYAKNLPRLKKSYDKFKADTEIQNFLIQSNAVRWKAVLDLKKPDGTLPRSAADELVSLMKSCKRVNKLDDYKWAQEQYEKYISPAKAKG